MCLTCLWTPPFIHPSMLPSSLPPLTPRVPGAMLCLLKRCVVSECAACHQYGWVTEVSGSNAVHCFMPALAVPLPVHIMCAGVLECVSMSARMHICGCVLVPALIFCMYVCVSLDRVDVLARVFTHSATARRVSIFVLGSLPAGIMNMLPLGACGTQAHYCLLNSRW